MQCKSLWIKASAKCVNVNVRHGKYSCKWTLLFHLKCGGHCAFAKAKMQTINARYAIAFGLCHNWCAHMWKTQLKIQFAIPFEKSPDSSILYFQHEAIINQPVMATAKPVVRSSSSPAEGVIVTTSIPSQWHKTNNSAFLRSCIVHHLNAQ